MAAGADQPTDRRLRVLWLIKALDPGGAERLLSFAAAVRDQERFAYEAAYLVPSMRGLVPELEAMGVPVHCLGLDGERIARWPVRLRRLLAAGHYDIIHVHSPYPAAVTRLIARTLPAGLRPKLVSTEHNVWQRYGWVTRVANSITFPLGDAHLAVSGGVRDSVWPGLRKHVEVVVHGIDVDAVRERRRFREETRAALGVGSEDVLIGTVAHFRASKAYPDLLAAAHELVSARASVRFVAVGGHGQLEAEMKALHRTLGLGERFTFLGNHDDPARILAGCDVFVLSSIQEGLPVALMEALAVGLPVVATRVGGIPEAVTDGVEGLLVPARHPDLLAEALLQLVDDRPRRLAMGEAAARRSRDFGISHAVRRMEDLYRKLVAA